MKTYCELYFSGTSDNLRAFVKELKDYINGDWKFWQNFIFYNAVEDECSF